MQTPANTAFSACRLSHCAGVEFLDRLKIQAFRPVGVSFHRFCLSHTAQGFDEFAAAFDTWQQGIAATWLFAEKVRLRTLWVFAVSAMNCVGMALTV